MGLLDVLEQLAADEELAKGTLQPLPSAAASPHNRQSAAPAQATKAKSRSQAASRKPERLSFLKPCPLCRGRAFVHGASGGFYCVTCQPGMTGHPVEACGPDRQPLAMDAELLPASESSHVLPEWETVENQADDEEKAHFMAAWPWIKEHKSALLAAGWTMAALVRRCKYRWPCGPWGVAWLPAWSKPGVAVSIGNRGQITFTFHSGSRTIVQAAHPPKP